MCSARNVTFTAFIQITELHSQTVSREDVDCHPNNMVKPLVLVYLVPCVTFVRPKSPTFSTEVQDWQGYRPFWHAINSRTYEKLLYEFFLARGHHEKGRQVLKKLSLSDFIYYLPCS